MKVNPGEIYRLRNGTVFGPLYEWDIGGGRVTLTNSISHHCWHPETGCETAGFEEYDIVELIPQERLNE